MITLTNILLLFIVLILILSLIFLYKQRIIHGGKPLDKKLVYERKAGKYNNDIDIIKYNKYLRLFIKNSLTKENNWENKEYKNILERVFKSKKYKNFINIITDFAYVDSLMYDENSIDFKLNNCFTTLANFNKKIEKIEPIERETIEREIINLIAKLMQLKIIKLMKLMELIQLEDSQINEKFSTANTDISQNNTTQQNPLQSTPQSTPQSIKKSHQSMCIIS